MGDVFSHPHSLLWASVSLGSLWIGALGLVPALVQRRV